MRNRVLAGSWILLFAAAALAQNFAPRETAKTTINAKEVAVEYGRPSLKGRSVDDLLQKLPADRYWRTGSEQVTTFKTDTDLLVGGQKVPAGKYSLYVHCPADGSYSLVLNSVLGQPLQKIFAAAPAHLANEPWPHFNYSKEIADKEVARATMKRGTAANADLFTIAFEPGSGASVMRLSWGEATWTVDVKGAK